MGGQVFLFGNWYESDSSGMYEKSIGVLLSFSLILSPLQHFAVFLYSHLLR